MNLKNMQTVRTIGIFLEIMKRLKMTQVPMALKGMAIHSVAYKIN